MWSMILRATHASKGLSQARYERRAEALYSALSEEFEYEGAFMVANRLADAMRSDKDDTENENEAQSMAAMQEPSALKIN